MNIVVILLVILLVVGWPGFGVHSWGYAPSGVAGTILLVLVILVLLGRL